MQMPLRAAFLIVARAVIFHLSFWPTVAILIGYAVCGYIDQSESKARRSLS